MQMVADVLYSDKLLIAVVTDRISIKLAFQDV